MRFEFEVEIARPVEDVFAYVTDVRNLPTWQAATSDASWIGEDGPRRGARIRQVTTFLGRTMELELEVESFEPNRRFDLRTVRGPISFTVHHSFERSDAGTTIHFVGEGRLSGVFRFASGVVAKQAERESRGDFDRLKTLLEARRGKPL